VACGWELERVATADHLEALARFNARQIGAESQHQFYFDPHTKHYTGDQNVLEGWCAAIRWADKAMHSDFIHTVSGEPLYFETTDNFADLRERFFQVVQRCRQVMKWPPERVLSFVVDRAWPRNEGLRQIVVQATNPRGRVIQVSVLTDDQKCAAGVILRLMFGRWVQENDFKYLDQHFGINQITSCGVTGYEELREQVQDRQVRSAGAKALREQRRQLRARQSRLLLAEARGEHQEAQRQERIKALEKQSDAGQVQKELARLRQGQTRWERTHRERREQIQKLSGELAQLDPKGEQAQQTRRGVGRHQCPGAGSA
jgi:hypothetical protein